MKIAAGTRIADHDRDAPDPRDRALVHPGPVAAEVDTADPGGYPRDQRRQGEHDADRREEAPDRRAVPNEGTQRLGEGHAAVIAEALAGKPESQAETRALLPRR